MRKEFSRLADGAVLERGNVCLRHACGQQLAAIGFTQVKMHLNTRIAVAGRALVHEQHGIALTHGVRLLHMVKKFSGVSKLRMKSVFHFLANFQRALLDSRPNRGMNIFRTRAKLQPHDAHAFFHDALHRPAPSGMKRAHSFLLCVDQQDREAISSKNAERHAAQISDHAIAGEPGLFEETGLRERTT